jgi:hypothetical protein
MPWLIIILVVIVLLLAPWANASRGRGRLNGTLNPAQAEVTVNKIKSLTQSELAAILKTLKVSQPPEIRLGALCYETVTIYERLEHFCQHCGEKTYYPRSEEANKLLALQELEREFGVFSQKSSLKMDMEVNGYCAHCDSGKKPQGATLIVTYRDGAVNRCFPFTLKDLNLIKALLTGKSLYDAGWDNEFVLRDEIPRLTQLLGVEPDRRL